MKKFLLVATVVKTHINTFHIPLLKMMKEKGYETHVCAKNDYSNPSECYIPYCDYFHDVSFNRFPVSLDNLKAFFELKQIIKQYKFDYIHCNTPIAGVLTRLSAMKSRKNNTKVIYTAHGFHFFDGAPYLNWILYYPIEKILSSVTDAIITINKEDYKRAKNKFYSKIFYIPGVGLDVEKYNYKGINKIKKRKELGINPDEFIITSVGEINKNKNHQLVIKALSELKIMNIQYLICGEGPLKKNLGSLSKELDIENSVKFLGYRDDIEEILEISDIFVFPSYREGLSLSVMEAMCSGLPILASKIRGNSDLVDENLGGYLFEPNDVDKLIYGINELYTDQNKRKQFGKYNKIKSKKFDVNKILKQIEKVYKNLCQESV